MARSKLTCYLYVLGCKDGPHKIGYSAAPTARVKAMLREGREGVFLAGAWPVGEYIARAAERYAHWLLREHHLDHEWFNVSQQAATDAVLKALEPEVVASYDPRNLIPALVTTPAKIKHGEYITTKFPKGTRARLRAILPDGNLQAEFIREAIEREIKRRSRKASEAE